MSTAIISMPRLVAPAVVLRPLRSNAMALRPSMGASTSINGNRRLTQSEYQDRRARTNISSVMRPLNQGIIVENGK